jgi:hypothetical protein
MDKIRKRQEIDPQYQTKKPKNDIKRHQSPPIAQTRHTLTRSVSTLDRASVSKAEIATWYAAMVNFERKFCDWALQPEARYGDKNLSI